MLPVQRFNDNIVTSEFLQQFHLANLCSGRGYGII